MREYLIDLVNDNPESFEDYEDHKVIGRLYGPMRTNRKRLVFSLRLVDNLRGDQDPRLLSS